MTIATYITTLLTAYFTIIPLIFYHNSDFICKLCPIDISNVMFNSRNFEYDFPLDIEHIESRSAYDVDGKYCWNEEKGNTVIYISILVLNYNYKILAEFKVTINMIGTSSTSSYL